MIDPVQWTNNALTRLRKVFDARLLYLGLQGSYRRGEATESSDIDLVVLLDSVSLQDLDVYRGIVKSMPEGEKACGFICGRQDFANWPRHELFPFKMDTQDIFGNLEDFLPAVTKEDICENARIGASGLYHFLTHSYLYAAQEERTDILKGAFKSAFFVMLVVNYIKSGTYKSGKKQLLDSLDGNDREIIQAGLNLNIWLSEHSEEQGFILLRDWCSGVLKLKP